MESKSKLLLKNLGILTISNFASKILVFMLVPLYTGVLSTTEYGIYDLVVSTVSLMVPVLSLNIVDAVMRFMMDKNYDKNEVATIGIKYISYSVVIIAIFLAVFNYLGIWQEIKGLEFYIFLYYLFYILNQYFIQLAKGLEKIGYMGIAGVIGTITMIATNVFFLLVFKWELTGFFLANILSQAIPVLYFFIKLEYWTLLSGFKTDKKIVSEMLVYCTPLIASVAGWWVNSGSDKYVVTFFCGVAANGVLSVAYKIPAILNTLQGIFIQAWQISAVKEYGEYDTAKFYGNTFSLTNLLMCASCSWLVIMTRPLAHLLYAKDFYIAWKFVPFLLISSVLNCASGFLGPVLSAKKDSKSMAISAVYGAGVNLILNITFVYLIGAQGVAIATVIASFIIYQVRRSAVGNDIKIEKYGIIIITWLLLCLQAVVEVYTSLWIVEMVIMVVMLIINIEEIKKVIFMISRLIKKEKSVK